MSIAYAEVLVVVVTDDTPSAREGKYMLTGGRPLDEKERARTGTILNKGTHPKRKDR